ncbi:signal transduction histidine kinase/DNA-binding response OmpR family regulator [Phycicoccus badiiscoriae]|uniref:Circadian input-output histidine kinase CikA n=1 Tax=Pedococcus badiiscoriae TaxID=642776 RepID=A0A852WHT6_9MICO|nr:response regulator [Pedococcus badiiscoriae]NYG06224.1 signal transduction histidine kinase/DNA-binding response OmpR family regulator [Pedococcus badiiscoriae]
MARSADVPVDPTPSVDAATLALRLRETQEQLAAVNEVLSAVGRSSGDPDTVLATIVDSARRLCRSDAAQLYLLDDDRIYQLIKAVGVSEESIAYIAAHPMPLDRDTLAGRVGVDRKAQQIEDVVADPEYGRLDLQRVAGFRTTMGAPLVVDDEVVGAMVLWRNEVSPFAEREMSIVTAFAAQAALAINGVRLVQELQAGRAELARKVDQLEALAEVGQAISSTLDPDEVLGTIVLHAVELSGADGGSLMEYDEESSLFRVRTAYGTSPEVIRALQETRIHLDETVVGRAALTGSPIQVPDLRDVELDPHLRVLHDAGWRSLVAIPMARPDRIVGVLVVRRTTTGAFTDETCDMLSAFASQSAVALINARLYRELERQRAELAVTSQHKSEFLASMSHELRTPLNAVIGFSEVLLERMFGDLNERQEDYLQDILSAGRHLLDLLNDVLDLSKVEAGHMELEKSTFPIADSVNQVLSLLRERAGRQGVTLVTDLTAGPSMVTADPLRFKQVLLNLVGNGVKFTPAGGTVTVAARRDGDELTVTVADTGIGIAQGDQERIFDSFQQGARSASMTEGTGLGLTLTRRIVELHGGRVWLTSEVGVGSTFGFTLPQPTAWQREEQPAWTHPDLDDTRPAVVVIEDDPSSSELVGVHLAAAGLRAVPVRSGEEGLEAIRALRPKAVVLDIRLPGMDGWDVLSQLKADPELTGTPVVVVSVLPDRGRGFALGASDYLVKPVAREVLLGAIWRAVADRADQPGTQQRRTLAVIDDDPTALEVVRATLEPQGWQVATFARGDEALRSMASLAPTVVLVDLLMPDTDGFAVIDALRADPGTAGVPVVVLTAKSLTQEDRARLQGRIEFVASKSQLDLGVLAQRLAQVATAGASTSPAGPGTATEVTG